MLGEVKARIRAEVFNAMDDPNEQRPQLSHENLLINELIREYLEFNRYKYTSSVLTAGDSLLHFIYCLNIYLLVDWYPTFLPEGHPGRLTINKRHSKTELKTIGDV